MAGLEALEMRRRAGLPDSAAHLCPTNWNYRTQHSVSEASARRLGLFAQSSSASVCLPMRLFLPGELAEDATKQVHTVATLAEERLVELILEARALKEQERVETERQRLLKENERLQQEVTRQARLLSDYREEVQELRSLVPSEEEEE